MKRNYKDFGFTFIACTLLLTPAITHAVWSAVQPSTNQPTFGSLLTPRLLGNSNEPRDALSDAVIDANPIRRWSLHMKFAFLYQVDLVNTDRVISGSYGWLFYKPQISNWSCNRYSFNARAADRLRFFVETSELVDLPITFAPAPNKATVMPERLWGDATSGERVCYDRTAALWRALGDVLPDDAYVDHMDIFETWSRVEPAYFRTDTHWTPEAGGAALAQLLGALPDHSLERIQYDSDTKVERHTDLSRMLSLNLSEQTAAAPVITPGAPPFSQFKVVVVHDSFIGTIDDQAREAFPGAQFLHVRRTSDAQYREAFNAADRVIFSIVERSLSDFALRLGSTRRNHPLGDLLFNRIDEWADQCRWDEAITLDLRSTHESFRFQNIEHIEGRGLHATSNDPQIIVSLPRELIGSSVCVRMEFEGAREIEVFDPGATYELQSEAPRPSAGRSLARRYTSEAGAFYFVLGPDEEAPWFRIDPQQVSGRVDVSTLVLAPVASSSSDR